MRESPDESPGRVRVLQRRSPPCGTICPSFCRGVTFDACGSERHPRVGAQSLRCFADSPVVQLRKKARRTSGKCGLDSHRSRLFGRAVELGLSVKRETASGFAPPPQPPDGWVPNSSLVRLSFSTGRRIGLSFITTWSLVRVQPLAQHAGVAQW